MKPDDTLSTEPRYRIGAVSRATGINPDTLRMWERRYGGMVPARSDGGGRLYSDADIARLRIVKQLIDRGHAIGRIAVLSNQDLRQILARHDEGQPESLPATSAASVREQFLRAVEALDVGAAQRLLARASLGLPLHVLVTELLVPILQEVGHRWAAGKLTIVHEHSASSLLRTVLGGLLATFPQPRTSRTLVVTTPAGELHEFGALLTAMLASAAGWHVLYLGPNLPAEEMLEAVKRVDASALALSLVTTEAPDATAEIETLLAGLPPEVSLLVGGEATSRYPALQKRALAFDDFDAFNAWLQSENQRPPGRS